LIAILGLPGAGKSTVSRAVAGELGAAVFPGGQMLAQAAHHGDEDAVALIDQGLPIPADRYLTMLQSWLEDEGPSLVLLDGSPRDVSQAIVLRDADLLPSVVIVLNVESTLARERLVARASYSLRIDDMPDAIERRLALQAVHLQEVVDLLAAQSEIAMVNASPRPNEVIHTTLEALRRCFSTS
jgi:adenylate kinase family enzyme